MNTTENHYFIILGYTGLDAVIKKIDSLISEDRTIVIFCLTKELYDFLSPSITRTKISLILLERKEKNLNIRFSQPLTFIRAKKETMRVFNKYFNCIPDGSNIYFYNTWIVLWIFYSVYRMRKRCKIFYEKTDPAGNYDTAITLSALLAWLKYFIVYPIPFRMVRGEFPIPELTKRFFKDIFIVQSITRNELTNNELKEMYKQSQCKVLWIMDTYIDEPQALISIDDYLRRVSACYETTLKYFDSSDCAIKYHPRAHQKEKFWKGGEEILLEHIPTEFYNFPNLKLVISFSSNSLKNIAKSNVTVISLLNFIPFRNEAWKKDLIKMLDGYKLKDGFLLPQNISELDSIISDLSNQLAFNMNKAK